MPTPTEQAIATLQLFMEDPTQFNGPLRYASIYRAFVVNVIDPQQRGRVQIFIPRLHSGIAAAHLPWAERCLPDGGSPDAGDFIPLKGSSKPDTLDGDGVWIVFEGNDPSLPVVLGTWPSRPNGISELPNESKATRGHNRRRIIKTRHGHRLEFGDEVGQHEIKIATASGHCIDLRESAGGTGIHIETAGGSRLSLQDEEPGTAVTPVVTAYDQHPDFEMVGINVPQYAPATPQPTANGAVQSLTQPIPAGLGRQGVLLETKDGHSIKMTDSDSKIEVRSKGGQYITIDDATGTITIAGGNVVNVSADVSIGFNAPLVTFDAQNCSWSMNNGVLEMRATAINFIEI